MESAVKNPGKVVYAITPEAMRAGATRGPELGSFGRRAGEDERPGVAIPLTSSTARDALKRLGVRFEDEK